MAQPLYKMKSMFFDSKKVMDACDKATRKVLSKFGAYVRTSAKSSIRPGGKNQAVSRPGEPPRSHTGLLKRFILFGYDTSAHSVVIGPARLGNTKSPDATETLEYGGYAKVSRQWVNRNGRRQLVAAKRHTVKIAQRAFMNPALTKELPKLPAMWRDSVVA